MRRDTTTIPVFASLGERCVYEPPLGRCLVRGCPLRFRSGQDKLCVDHDHLSYSYIVAATPEPPRLGDVARTFEQPQEVASA